jgi:hypothetical protein
MSSAYVRAQFRAAVAASLPAPWVYVESINVQRVAELPPQWFTLDFPPADVQPISLGRPALYRESGAPSITVATPQALGDALALAGAELVRTALIHFVDATGHLRVLTCSPPTELDGGDFFGAWYRQTIDVRYQFDDFA